MLMKSPCRRPILAGWSAEDARGISGRAGHVGQVKGGRGGVKANQQQNVSAAFAPGSQRQGKDDAYAEFMKEMEQMNAF